MIDLKLILQKYPNCLSSRASFKSILMDTYPTEKRMVNILTILYECGVVNKIKTKTSIDSNEMQRLIAQIESEYGISRQYSQEAVLIWAQAFDVTTVVIKVSSFEESCQKHAEPIVYVQGNVADYEIKLYSNGWYITKYNGFEEDELVIPNVIDGKQIVGVADGVFRGLTTTKRIYVSADILEVGENCFANSLFTNIFLPSSLKKIGSGAFQECRCLKEIDIPDAVEEIPNGCFEKCASLSRVNLPNQLRIIKRKAFSCWNTQLREIRIPMGTQIIEDDAFLDDDELKNIYIPPTVTKIGPYNFYSRTRYGPRAVSDVTIHCAAGSVAMEYARKNNFKCAKAQF